MPSDLPAHSAVLAHSPGLLDVIEVAALDERTRYRLPIEEVAGLYFALSSRMGQL